jgi:hypothetical protein
MQLYRSWLLARWPHLVKAIGGVLVIAVLLTRWTVTLSDAPIIDDAAQNLRMAYNFATHGVLSSDADDLSPTDYREPLPPIVLGIYLKVLKLLRGPISFGSLVEGPGARLAKLSNVIWGILLCLSVFAALKVLTGTYILAHITKLVSLGSTHDDNSYIS